VEFLKYPEWKFIKEMFLKSGLGRIQMDTGTHRFWKMDPNPDSH